MSRPVLHQFLTGATAGDAITNQALLMRGWLRALGYESDVYAQYIHANVEQEVRPLAVYRRQRHETWAVYRHSIGSPVPDFLKRQGLRLFLIYHNITPAAFFERVDPARAELARQGLAQLARLRDVTGFAVADSSFNARDLAEAGYGDTAVLPITLEEAQLDQPLDADLARTIRQKGPALLFVSRMAPNKRQEDLVKLMLYLQRIRPDVHLWLAGSRWEVGYDRWVENLAADLGLAHGVTLTGKVSQQALVTFYRTADLYVSMSEHEGFGVPLIESMYCGLPVLAYGVTAVPATLETAGVLFTEKRYAELAELVDLLLTDRPLRERLIAHGRERVQAFLEPQTRALFETYLKEAGVSAGF